MKLDRLIGILSVLLQKDRVTTAELSEKFEVSRRTIVRDIEAINMAGIPVAAERGKNGGVYIMNNYKLDRTLLSSKELNYILTGLQSLDSISGTNGYKQLMDKLSADAPKLTKTDDTIIIDLSGWGGSALSKKMDTVKSAMDNDRTLSFSYYSPNGVTQREIEPYHLIFQWSGWYVWGYCLLRGDYRMFKLARIADLELTNNHREKRIVPEYVSDKLRHTAGEISVQVKFDKSVKWRLADEFENEALNTDVNGDVIMSFTWSDKESFFRYIVTFGGSAEILSPKEYRADFKEFIKKIAEKYE